MLFNYYSQLQTGPHQEHICGRFLRRMCVNLYPKEVYPIRLRKLPLSEQREMSNALALGFYSTHGFYHLTLNNLTLT